MKEYEKGEQTEFEYQHYIFTRGRSRQIRKAFERYEREDPSYQIRKEVQKALAAVKDGRPYCAAIGFN